MKSKWFTLTQRTFEFAVLKYGAFCPQLPGNVIQQMMAFALLVTKTKHRKIRNVKGI